MPWFLLFVKLCLIRRDKPVSWSWLNPPFSWMDLKNLKISENKPHFCCPSLSQWALWGVEPAPMASGRRVESRDEELGLWSLAFYMYLVVMTHWNTKANPALTTSSPFISTRSRGGLIAPPSHTPVGPMSMDSAALGIAPSWDDTCPIHDHTPPWEQQN